LYEQALLLMRGVGDRAGEATILNNLAAVSQSKNKIVSFTQEQQES